MVSGAGGRGLGGSCMFSGTRSSPSPGRGDGVVIDRDGASPNNPGVDIRVGARFPGMGNENTESRLITDSSSGDTCSRGDG
jgi:hypothetical protein